MRTLYDALPEAGLANHSIEQQARDLYYTGMHLTNLRAIHLKNIYKYLRMIDDIVVDITGVSHAKWTPEAKLVWAACGILWSMTIYDTEQSYCAAVSTEPDTA